MAQIKKEDKAKPVNKKPEEKKIVKSPEKKIKKETYKVRYFQEIDTELTITYYGKEYSYKVKNGFFDCDNKELKETLLNMNCELMED
jgi:hypothetical protein